MEQKYQIQIKGMVCDRCILFVKTKLEQMGFIVQKISLGSVRINKSLTPAEQSQLEEILSEADLQVISSRQHKLISQVKSVIHQALESNYHYGAPMKFSKQISESLGLNYSSISKLFSEHEGITLEQYFISIRIEKVKNLLTSSTLSATEIAYMTGYSSVNHMSHQFKEHQGHAPTFFRKAIPEMLNATCS
ncbi:MULTISPECIES: AraC family transcriptional regulator [unclassified Imperialibacter]|uniref:helix-turn-helix domain-containing protein n=1 Tax=unclassified Imperialibacter TaxID=2629706 RepID=UPI0012557778|nr:MULTISPECIES: AraC family transcriptional regulator [unclassified Imperialibacter]CAD5282648.1 AraC family transcriptional regulator [Imperialibacter sp. 89]CAD5286967.1 AraC family transcriptional regulator [Imperialibacter sp. 75]VVT30316.1 Transcriptional regulator, AraC family [Imperialibacter sp. EC-SDR9]